MRTRIAPLLAGAGLAAALASTANLANMSTTSTVGSTHHHDDDDGVARLETDVQKTLLLLDDGDDDKTPTFHSEPTSSAAASTSPPIFRPFTHLATLAGESIPTRTNAKRLIIVGDVHGMRAALQALLQSVGFDGGANDRVIFAGDLINKGPDSAGVVDFAIDVGALAVRGNHEDKVLRTVGREAIEKHSQDDDDDDDAILVTKAELRPSKKKNKHKHKHDGLKRRHLRWLAELPLILHVGDVQGMGDVVVVHAGLVPGVRLEEQDPWAVLNMRSLARHQARSSEQDSDGGRVPVDSHDGQSWSSAWNTYQRTLPSRHRTTVLYGHDSKRGLRVRRYTMGLDSGCVSGGQLTAVVIEGGGGGVTHRLVHADCGDIE